LFSFIATGGGLFIWEARSAFIVSFSLAASAARST
jgi:hypothetical protein